jgi:prepilin-type N-terminal cleavage/methylation domain-containing protein
MKKAFTVIETLVVIAIIAILLACLFPIFAMANQGANKNKNYTVVQDEYVAGHHIQVIEDNTLTLKQKWLMIKW